MKLHQLLQELARAARGGRRADQPDLSADLSIEGVAYDSRKIAPDWLFVAVRGNHTDGHRYIAEAFRRGARAAVGEEPAPAEMPAGARYIQVRDSRRDLAWLADSFYDHPSRKMGVIGITGTKGKSTTTNLIAEALEHPRHTSGADQYTQLSHWRPRFGRTRRARPPRNRWKTTAMLAEMARQQVRYAVVETSSHGLALHRVSGIVYDVGIATNITSEHLEFHGTVEQYRRDKAQLFEGLDPAADEGWARKKLPSSTATTPATSICLPFCRVPALTYAIDQQADIRAVDLELTGAASRFRVVTPTGETRIDTPLMGRFNVYNCLATISAGYTQGLDLDQMGETLAHISGVPGRMERIDCGQPFTVIVDYAHNPDSLEQVLRLLRPLTPGRVIAVFGSAGERDTQKRPKQGAISAQLADLTFLTDEDCREEDPHKILHEIATGALEAGATLDENLWLIVDRRQAIAAAFDAARPGDTVLLAGKGHEHSIIVGRESLPWDERDVARELLRDRWTSAGPRLMETWLRLPVLSAPQGYHLALADVCCKALPSGHRCSIGDRRPSAVVLGISQKLSDLDTAACHGLDCYLSPRRRGNGCLRWSRYAFAGCYSAAWAPTGRARYCRGLPLVWRTVGRNLARYGLGGAHHSAS